MKFFVKIATATVAVAIMSAPAAFAAGQGPWNGPYVGGQLQLNTTSSDTVSSANALGIGIFAGYQFQLSQHLALGVEGFLNDNQQKTHTVTGLGNLKFSTRVYGVNGIVGFPLGNMSTWMPYVKVGYGWLHISGSGPYASGSSNSLRYGLGIAWRLNPNLSLQAQYMYQKLGSGTQNFKDKNLSVGVSWHFQSQ